MKSSIFSLVKKDSSILWKYWYFAYQNFGGQVDDLWEYAPLWLKSGKQKTHSLMRISHATARSMAQLNI